eukprot:TRINITY_DN6109_c1_g1_i1.p1 TRINITY_DN6109_c1_g1~~TRINITY_DN6109_c1_g1_i1.p1  ORF type:complete len:1144 (-),score=229.56 TRINITY_DN6109_c1_g1_i1:176-3361(-)
MVPWYRGFKGKIVPLNGAVGKYEVWGTAVKRGRTRLEITELPVRRWTQDYKEWLLEQLPQSGDEKRATVTEVREHHSENSVHFVVSMTPDKLAEADRRGIEKVFHLRGNISTTNMHLFDADGHLQKYHSPEQIIEAFIPVRLGMYTKRKAHLLQKLQRDLAVISNKMRFVKLVISEELLVEGRKTAELCLEMRKLGLQTMREIEVAKEIGRALEGIAAAEQAAIDQGGPMGYKYLISMKMWSLTEEKVLELMKQHDQRSKEIEDLQATPLETFWERDLVKLEDALDLCDREDAKEAEAAAKMAAKVMGDTALVNKQCVIVLSHNYTIKRVRTSEWKARRKGNLSNARGGALDRKATKKIGGDGDAEADEEDDADALAGVFVCYDFDALLVFSEHGMCYMIQALDVPLAKKMNAAGTSLTDFLPELGSRKITALITVPQGALKDQSDEFVVLVTALGMAKKMSLDRFRALRPGKGIVAMTISSGDSLKWAHRASANCALVVGTQDGNVLRTSLGPNWRQGTTKGRGMKVIKMRGGHASGDQIAATAVHEMSEHERKTICDAILRKKVEDSTRPDGDGDDAVGDDAAEGGPPTTAMRVLRRGGDDDDSDNCGQLNNDGVEEEDEDGAEEDDAAGEDEAAEDEEIEKNEADPQAIANFTSEGQKVDDDATKEGLVATHDDRCLLLVTSRGMSLRMPLSCRRARLLRRGACGNRAIKLADNDIVVSINVVSNRDNAGMPDPSRAPFQIWYAEAKAGMEEHDNEHGVTSASCGAGLVAATQLVTEKCDDMAGVKGFEFVHKMREKFRALPEEVQKVFIERGEEERKRYKRKMEEYAQSQTACEELLLGSSGGNISRISVGSIPILTRAARGRTIAKCAKGDLICAVSLLSALETVHDEAEGSVTGAAVVIPNSSSETTQLASEALDTCSAGVSSAEAPGTPPAAPKLAVTRSPSGFSLGDGCLPSLSVTPGDNDRSPRRLRRKTSKGGNVPPWRRCLSHLCNTPRPPTPKRSNSTPFLTCSKHVRHTMVKMKMRPLGGLRRMVVTRTVDIAEWARYVLEDGSGWQA